MRNHLIIIPRLHSAIVTQITPVRETPSLHIRGRKSILCVSDLHLGYELELRESGFNVPPQIDNILGNLLNIEEGDHLMILGDLKHTIPYTSRREVYDLNHFFNSLEERFSSIGIITGNHDGSLRRSLPRNVELHDSSGVRTGTVGLIHGHRWPSEDVINAEELVWSHLHPSIRITDRMGGSHSIKCWLRGVTHPEKIGNRYAAAKVKRSIVMPSFNPLLVGTPINEKGRKELSPLTRSGFVILDEQHAHTLDGIDLGEISSLTFCNRKNE